MKDGFASLFLTGASGILIALALATSAEANDASTALEEGNRFFRNGDIEAAVAAYEAGYVPEDPHPMLAYNLGAALHRLGRLPEAILWYHRAGDLEDPWLEDNLLLARRSLGSQALPAGGWASLVRHGSVLRWIAVVLAWMTLGLVVFRRHLPLGGALALAGACVLVYGTALALDHWGPQPAVFLVDCETSAGLLPAGTEAWVHGPGDDGFRIAGSDVSCPAEAVALIRP